MRCRAVLEENIEFDTVFGLEPTGVAKGFTCVLSLPFEFFRAFSREVSSNSCGESWQLSSMARGKCMACKKEYA